MIEFGDYRYDPVARVRYRGDVKVAVTPQVRAVLELLLAQPGEAIADETLRPETITQLRVVLGDRGEAPTYIEKTGDTGYRLIAEVPDADRTVLSTRPRTRADSAGLPHAEATTPATSTGAFQRGHRLGSYEILAPLGAGAMGEVWWARDTTLDREVALKIIPAELAADPELMERFSREARMLAAIDHPNIVTAYSVEESDGFQFITMQLVDGRTLDDLIPEDGLPLDELLELAIPLVSAIGAAHERGITHRDLKPANIMVSDDGWLRVLDFGIAKPGDGSRPADKAGDGGRVQTDGDASPNLTEAGTIIGTLTYMSPEQAVGKPADARSDLFSLGVTLYEMATGVRPFRGGGAARMCSTPSCTSRRRRRSC